MKTRFRAASGVKLLFAFVLIFVSQAVFTYSGGPPAGYSGAPGESNCTSCHTGSAITSGSVWNSITLVRNGAGGLSGTQANASNSMTLSASSALHSTFGFMLCVLPSSATSSTASLGTLSAGNSTTQTTTSSSPSRIYLEQTSNGNTFASGNATWNFNWITPSSYSGGATFYVAINMADGDASSAGDNIYIKSFSATVLPVKWLDFSVAAKDNGVMLTWSTAQEINNDRFVVERSENGVEFISIGEVKGKGNTTSNSYYSFRDEDELARPVFYRIRQIDQDGVLDYSKVVSFDPVKMNQPVVTLDPAGKTLHVMTTSGEIEGLKIITPGGEVLCSYGSESSGRYSTQLIPPGVYLIQVSESGGNQYLKKIFLQ